MFNYTPTQLVPLFKIGNWLFCLYADDISFVSPHKTRNVRLFFYSSALGAARGREGRSKMSLCSKNLFASYLNCSLCLRLASKYSTRCLDSLDLTYNGSPLLRGRALGTDEGCESERGKKSRH